MRETKTQYPQREAKHRFGLVGALLTCSAVDSSVMLSSGEADRGQLRCGISSSSGPWNTAGAVSGCQALLVLLGQVLVTA